jgi:hypothetical protein
MSNTYDELEIVSIFYMNSGGHQSEYTVGKNATEIKEYPTMVEGDKWRWVIVNDDITITVFNPETVTRKRR